MVPATPSVDAARADVTAASALAATWATPRSSRAVGVSEGAAGLVRSTGGVVLMESAVPGRVGVGRPVTRGSRFPGPAALAPSTIRRPRRRPGRGPGPAGGLLWPPARSRRSAGLHQPAGAVRRQPHVAVATERHRLPRERVEGTLQPVVAQP